MKYVGDGVGKKGPVAGSAGSHPLYGFKVFNMFAMVAGMVSGLAMEKEDETGTIEPGKSADFIVINQNILEVPAEKIHETKVLRTVLQSKTVFEHKSGGGRLTRGTRIRAPLVVLGG